MRLILLGCPTLFLLACQNPAPVTEPARTLQVIGFGKVRASPDQVDLTVHAEFTRPAMVDAARMVQSTLAEAHRIARVHVAEPKDIRTTRVSTSKDYRWERDSQVFQGFNASQTVDITLKDISRFERLTQELLATRITNIDNLAFSHSRADSLLREADLRALDDATALARKLAARAGVRLGRIMHLSNHTPAVPGHLAPAKDGVFRRAEVKSFAANQASGFQVSPETLEFTREAYVTYEILAVAP